MDQEAFRQLVSSSSTISSSASSSRSFGKTHKRAPTSATTASSSTSSTKPSDLKPRKLSSNYIDRASARRSGHTSSEFNDIESLHRDFEERIAAAETEQERQTLREQISSVGGDARYSVLVKGLDWALLAQNKARIEREKDGGEGAAEGELEEAYQEGRAEQIEGKRSREQIVEAIKRRREGRSHADGKEDSAEKKFRPIGFKPMGAPGESVEQETAEYKWVNGKRMRKKKKAEVLVEPSGAKEKDEARASQARDRITHTQESVKVKLPPNVARGKAEQSRTAYPARDIPAKAKQGPTFSPSQLVNTASTKSIEGRDAGTEPSIAPEPKSIPAAAPHHQDEEEDDDDSDIFADVGGWDGIPSPTDDDHPSLADDTEPALAPAPPGDRAPSPLPPSTPPTQPSAPAPLQPTSSPTDTVPLSTALPHPLPQTTTPDPASAVDLHPPQHISTPEPDPTSHAPIPAPSAEPPKLKKKSKWDDDDDDVSTKKRKKKKH